MGKIGCGIVKICLNRLAQLLSGIFPSKLSIIFNEKVSDVFNRQYAVEVLYCGSSLYDGDGGGKWGGGGGGGMRGVGEGYKKTETIDVGRTAKEALQGRTLPFGCDTALVFFSTTFYCVLRKKLF